MTSQDGMDGMHGGTDSMQFVYLRRHMCNLVRQCIPRQCYVMSF